MPAIATEKDNLSRPGKSNRDLFHDESSLPIVPLSKTEEVKIFLKNNPIPKEFLKKKTC